MSKKTSTAVLEQDPSSPLRTTKEPWSAEYTCPHCSSSVYLDFECASMTVRKPEKADHMFCRALTAFNMVFGEDSRTKQERLRRTFDYLVNVVEVEKELERTHRRVGVFPEMVRDKV